MVDVVVRVMVDGAVDGAVDVAVRVLMPVIVSMPGVSMPGVRIQVGGVRAGHPSGRYALAMQNAIEYNGMI
jgi:hypothetical protein